MSPNLFPGAETNLQAPGEINDFGGRGRVLGRCRGGLGAFWGCLGGVLGSLGRVLGRLGSVLGPLEGVLGRLEADFVTPTVLFEAPRPETLYFTQVPGGRGPGIQQVKQHQMKAYPRASS